MQHSHFSSFFLSPCILQAGLIRTDSGEFFIEPLERGQQDTEARGRAHVVYPRTAVQRGPPQSPGRAPCAPAFCKVLGCARLEVVWGEACRLLVSGVPGHACHPQEELGFGFASFMAYCWGWIWHFLGRLNHRITESFKLGKPSQPTQPNPICPLPMCFSATSPGLWNTSTRAFPPPAFLDFCVLMLPCLFPSKIWACSPCAFLLGRNLGFRV